MHSSFIYIKQFAGAQAILGMSSSIFVLLDPSSAMKFLKKMSDIRKDESSPVVVGSAMGSFLGRHCYFWISGSRRSTTFERKVPPEHREGKTGGTRDRRVNYTIRKALCVPNWLNVETTIRCCRLCISFLVCLPRTCMATSLIIDHCVLLSLLLSFPSFPLFLLSSFLFSSLPLFSSLLFSIFPFFIIQLVFHSSNSRFYHRASIFIKHLHSTKRLIMHASTALAFSAAAIGATAQDDPMTRYTTGVRFSLRLHHSSH